jgi:hypothetical protein
MGDAKLPGIAAEDIGRCAHGLFKRGHEFVGRTVGIAGEHPTVAEMAAALTQALGREVRYVAVEPAVFRDFGFPGADDLGNMFQYQRDFNAEFCGARSVEFSRFLNPKLQSFAQWLAANSSRIVRPHLQGYQSTLKSSRPPKRSSGASGHVVAEAKPFSRP